MKRKIELVMGVLLVGCALYYGMFGGKYLHTIEAMLPIFQEVNLKGIKVVIDPGHGGDDPGKIGIDQCKEKDLKRRCEIVENVEPAFTISIHQNSYTQEYVKGAQVFYYTQSKESEALAKAIQKGLIQKADKENTREAKANDSYYLLRKTVSPTVIVECGFLSNSQEAKKLQQKSYQKKIIQGIYTGVTEYMKETQSREK